MGCWPTPLARIAEGEPGGESALAIAEAATGLAEGDRTGARTRSLEALAAESGAPLVANPHAAAVWWVGALFGPEAAGGEEAIDEARELLERNGWRQALRSSPNWPPLRRRSLHPSAEEGRLFAPSPDSAGECRWYGVVRTR